MFGAIIAITWIVGLIWIGYEVKNAPMQNEDTKLDEF